MSLEGIKNTIGQGISTMASGVVSGTKMAAHGVLTVTAEVSNLAAKSAWYIGPAVTAICLFEALLITKSFSSSVVGVSLQDEVLRSEKIMDLVNKKIKDAVQLTLITPVAAWTCRKINQLATKANQAF